MTSNSLTEIEVMMAEISGTGSARTIESGGVAAKPRIEAETYAEHQGVTTAYLGDGFEVCHVCGAGPTIIIRDEYGIFWCEGCMNIC